MFYNSFLMPEIFRKILHREEQQKRKENKSPYIIMVPYDGSEESRVALSIAADNAKSLEEGVVYPVYPIKVERSKPLDVESAEEMEKGNQSVGEAEEFLQRINVGFRDGAVIQERHRWAAVLDEAEAERVSEIVVGVKAKEYSGVLDLGEFAEHILNHASCKVTLIRMPITHLSPRVSRQIRK